MLRLVAVVIRSFASLVRSRRELVLENLALRQQLATMVQKARPRIRTADRVLLGGSPARLVALGRSPRRREARDRRGVAPGRLPGLYWQRLSRRGRSSGRPAVAGEVRELIRRMATENHWRAPRIHGELLRSASTSPSARCPATCAPCLTAGAPPELAHLPGESSRDHRGDGLLHCADGDLSHALRSVRDRPRPARHRALEHHGAPVGAWVSQQLREAFPFDSGSRYLVFDRDTIFSAEVVRVVRSMSIEPTRTSYRSPLQNGVAERFVGTVRRELLDHLIVLVTGTSVACSGSTSGTTHGPPHLGLEKHAPMGRLVEPRPAGATGVHAGPWVGGLHHRYSWRAPA